MTSNEEKQILYKLVTFITSGIITIMLSISGWFIKQNTDSIAECRKDIAALKLNHAQTDSNRFTSSDWMTHKAILDQERLQVEKRISTIEETNKQVRELLSEIKGDIKELREEHYNPK